VRFAEDSIQTQTGGERQLDNGEEDSTPRIADMSDDIDLLVGATGVMAT